MTPPSTANSRKLLIWTSLFPRSSIPSSLPKASTSSPRTCSLHLINLGKGIGISADVNSAQPSSELSPPTRRIFPASWKAYRSSRPGILKRPTVSPAATFFMVSWRSTNSSLCGPSSIGRATKRPYADFFFAAPARTLAMASPARAAPTPPAKSFTPFADFTLRYHKKRAPAAADAPKKVIVHRKNDYR